MAVPVVLVSVLIAFTAASATVIASVSTQSGTVRDQRAKEALATAEAGVNHALLHYNRMAPSAPTTCLFGALSSVVAAEPATETGWCREVSGTVTGQPGSAFRYSVRPCGPTSAGVACPSIAVGTAASSLDIVSTGTVAGVSRRVHVTARSSGGLRPFSGNASVIGLDSIRTSNSTLTANVATNGDISLNGPESTLTCGYAQVGTGHAIVPESAASCPAVQGTKSLPPVNQGDIGDIGPDHSNNRFFALDPMAPPCLPSSTCWTTTNPSRQLRIPSNHTLTLGGSDYSLCKLTLASNANLYVQAGASVRIYFDAPENCPGLAATDGSYRQLEMASNARMTGTTAAHLALLFVGSDALATDVVFSSNTLPGQNCEQDFVVYGPRTAINIAANSSFCGALAAKSVTVSSNSSVTASDPASGYQLPNSVAAHYAAERFVECNPVAGASPSDGC